MLTSVTKPAQNPAYNEGNPSLARDLTQLREEEGFGAVVAYVDRSLRNVTKGRFDHLDDEQFWAMVRERFHAYSG